MGYVTDKKRKTGILNIKDNEIATSDIRKENIRNLNSFLDFH